jgi:hypothetical protein
MEKIDKYPWEVGMTVAEEHCRHDQIIMGKVIKLTKTQVVVSFGNYEKKFSRQKGTYRVDAFSWYSIRPATVDDVNEIKKQKLCYKLSKVKWETLLLEQLQRIDTIVSET